MLKFRSRKNGRDSSCRSLRGVIAAIPTPVDSGRPDPSRLISLAKYLLTSGCDGLNVLGTTGEATSFSVVQRMAVMSAIARAKLPLDRMIVGTGAVAVADAVKLSRHAGVIGFAAALLLPPFYYKGVPDDGMVTFVRRIVESTAETGIPIYLYNFPALSGVSYTLPLIMRLMEEFGTRIAGLKDSSGDLSYAKSVAALSKDLDVFPSSEATLPEARSGRFAGCISATANVNSRYCASAYGSGDKMALARAAAIRRTFDGFPMVSSVKYLLSELHSDPNLAFVMPPLSVLTSHQANVIRTRYQVAVG